MEPDLFNLVGRVLASRYFIREAVGEDLSGVLYKATCTDGHSVVAIKCLKITDGEERHFLLSRFRDEERALSKLKQSLLGLHVLDHGIASIDGLALPFVVMDWLEGQFLDTPQRRTLPPPSDLAAIDFAGPKIAKTDRMGIADWQLKPAPAFSCSKSNQIHQAAFSSPKF